jgi:hypothetical protein
MSTLLALRTGIGRLPPDVQRALRLFFAFRLPWLLVIGAIASRFAPDDGWTGMPPLDGASWAQNWLRWDSGWYVRIIRDGYVASRCGFPGEECVQASIAFTPAYPMLVRAIMHLGLSLSVASFLLNAALLIAALLGIQRLARQTVGEEAASRVAWVLLAFPTSLFFSAGYSEVLFFAAAVWAFVCLLEDRALPASALLAVAALARPYGLVFAACFLLGCVVRKRHRIAIAAGSTFAVAYGGYLWWQRSEFGDALAFVHARRAWGFNGSAIRTFAKYASRTFTGEIWFSGTQDFIAIALVLYAAFWSYRRKLGWDVTLFCLVLGLVPLSQGQVWGMSRGMLGAFPIFLMLATVKERFRRPLFALGILMGTANAFLFVRGVFVA